MRLGIEIFNDAWADNWGFVPVTDREVSELIKSIAPVVRPEGVIFALVGDRPEGILVGLPNLNEATADLGGRLLPFGWLKLLWRLRVRRLRSARVILMGVRMAHRNSTRSGALAAVLLAEALRVARALGVERGE